MEKSGKRDGLGGAGKRFDADGLFRPLGSFQEVLDLAHQKRVSNRMAALMIGISRVAAAMHYRGLHP